MPLTHEQELLINQKFIEGLDKSAQWAVTQWMMECWQKLWFFRITRGKATLLEQTMLYGQGRWLPGPKVTWTITGSKHLQGLAVDIYISGGQTFQQMEDLGAKWGITRPLKNVGDADHFEFVNALQPPPPAVPLPIQLKEAERRLAIEKFPLAIFALTNKKKRIKQKLGL